jgi:hypothetical protein
MNPCDYFLRVYFKDCGYRSKLHAVRLLQVEIEAVAEEITGYMLCDILDNFVVHLQWVHKVEGSHIEHAFT